MTLAACDALDDSATPAAGPAPLAAVEGSTALITSDPLAFASALREVDNENEVIVVMKGAAEPQRATSSFGAGADDLVIARPRLPGLERSDAGFAPVTDAAYATVLETLVGLGVTPYRHASWAEMMNVRIPDALVEPVVTALLSLPVVDYVEANQRRQIRFDTGSSSALPDPQGSNNAANQHTNHHVLEAWGLSRGAGAVIGVLDSGFAYSVSSGQYHRDGSLLTANRGVHKLGFVDDYDGASNRYAFARCEEDMGQPDGACVPWDDGTKKDNPHGTWMTGIVGANDNDADAVGIAPDALTISMKISQDDGISDEFWSTAEDDDLCWAVTWARRNRVDVLSMSFSGAVGSCSSSALRDAHNLNNILLVSSAGNDPGEFDRQPQAHPQVMAVGSATTPKSPIEEIIAQDRGVVTLDAQCPPNDFCIPGTVVNFTRGGRTSSATAIVAGVAGLVVSYERANGRSISGPELRRRLRATANVGEDHRVDALSAITQLRTSVDGTIYATTPATYTWRAVTNGGQAAYTYV